MQSDMFEGGKLGAMPLLIFLMTFGGIKLVQHFSTTSLSGIGLMISVFGLFSGLTASSTVFSSRSASRNTLKKKTFLIYSSRTLPTTSTNLMTAFFIKNTLFYLGLYLLPVGLAAVLVEPALTIYMFYMIGLFALGQLIGILLAKHAVKIPVRKFLNYYNLRSRPLTKKFFLDIYRSSGGLLKVFISTAALLGLYFYAANYVPLADYLLAKPMLSFSIILGLSTITVYNWLNTYDSIQDYFFMPVNENDLLTEKFKAFKIISLATVALFVTLFYLIEGGNLVLGLVLGASIAYYTGSLNYYFAGLHPNENMVNSVQALKFMVLLNIFIIPLLGYTSMDVNTHIFYQASGLMIITGLTLEKFKQRQ